jgi:O-antigen/teichoic acid export membrane protein
MLRSLIRVFASRALGLALAALAGFAITRFMLGHFGVAPYAFFSLLVTIPVLLPFGDLGAGASLVNTLAQSPEPEQDDDVARHLLSALRITTACAVGLILTSAVLYLAGLWPEIIRAPSSIQGVASTTAIAVALFALWIPLSLGQRLFLGLGKIHLQQVLQGLQLPLTFALILVGTRFLGPPAGGLAPLAFFVSMVVIGAATLLWARRYVGPSIRWAVRHLLSRRARGARVMHIGLPMLAQTALIPVAVQSDRIILAHFSTTHEVALYALVAQVFTAVQALVTAAGLSLWPVFTRQQRAGKRIFVARYSLLFAGFSASMCLVIVLVEEPVFRLLSEGRLQIGMLLLLAFGLETCVQAALYPIGMSMMDARGVRFQVPPIACSVIANIALSVVLSRSLGASGPVLATAGATLVFQLVPYAWYVRARTRRAARAAAQEQGTAEVGQRASERGPVLPRTPS